MAEKALSTDVVAIGSRMSVELNHF